MIEVDITVNYLAIEHAWIRTPPRSILPRLIIVGPLTGCQTGHILPLKCLGGRKGACQPGSEPRTIKNRRNLTQDLISGPMPWILVRTVRDKGRVSLRGCGPVQRMGVVINGSVSTIRDDGP